MHRVYFVISILISECIHFAKKLNMSRRHYSLGAQIKFILSIILVKWQFIRDTVFPCMILAEFVWQHQVSKPAPDVMSTQTSLFLAEKIPWPVQVTEPVPGPPASTAP